MTNTSLFFKKHRSKLLGVYLRTSVVLVNRKSLMIIFNFTFCLFFGIFQTGVEGTSLMLLSSRSVSRATMRIEGEEEEEEEEGEKEEVKIPIGTANGACARNPNEEYVHLWTARPTGSDVFEEDDQEVEEEEGNDEMERGKENGEKVALLPGALSGHSAVDESPARTGKLQVVSRDPSAPSSTLTAVQWTIEWTPRVDVPHHTSSSVSSNIQFPIIHLGRLQFGPAGFILK